MQLDVSILLSISFFVNWVIELNIFDDSKLSSKKFTLTGSCEDIEKKSTIDPDIRNWPGSITLDVFS